MRSGPHWLLSLLLLTALGGCARCESPSVDTGTGSGAPAARNAEREQKPGPPDSIAGFAAGPAIAGAGFVRRTYARGRVLISVTMAQTDMSAEGFASWTKTSRASFPQARLDLPPEDANGFYQCSNDAPPSCDLLIQLRSGLHVEIRGDGTSSRDDVDAIARGLALRAPGRR